MCVDPVKLRLGVACQVALKPVNSSQSHRFCDLISVFPEYTRLFPGNAESARSNPTRNLLCTCLDRLPAKIGPAKKIESCEPVLWKLKSTMLMPASGIGKLNVPSYKAPA